MTERYKPVYGEYYYTIDDTLPCHTPGDIVVRYKWLDLDDDQKLLAKHLVFKTRHEAEDAASGSVGPMEQ